MEEDELSSFLGGLGTKPGSGNAPADVPQAATTADLERLCTDRGGLCALALLDASDEGFQGQLGMFREAAGKWAKQPLHFCWVDAARQVGACNLLCHPAAHAHSVMLQRPCFITLLLPPAHAHAHVIYSIKRQHLLAAVRPVVKSSVNAGMQIQ